MRVCVIGGGVSGLYLATCLTELGHNIDLYEKTENIGGRIMTCQLTDNILYEAGAGRFNKSHKRLIRLLKKLELFHKVKPIYNQREFKVNSRNYDYNRLINETLFKNVLLLENEGNNEQYLKSITLKQYMNELVGKSKTQQIINAFGYNSEFELQNAYTSLRIFRKDFNDNIQYYYLQDGLSQIINYLRDQVIKQKSNNIYLETEVTDYDIRSNTITSISRRNDKTYLRTYDKVVFCVTKQSLLYFSRFLEKEEKLFSYLNNSIEMAPLQRIFAKFPIEDNGLVWFHDIKRITTNLPIRYIIPLNAQAGLIQISYTDKQFAEFWNSFSNDTELIDELMKNLKILYPHKKISKPIWIKRYFWKEGATYWKPNYKVYKNSRDNNYYIAGEITSQFHSGWIEGSLESVDNIIKFFD